jgi:hypothetical protein
MQLHASLRNPKSGMLNDNAVKRIHIDRPCDFLATQQDQARIKPAPLVRLRGLPSKIILPTCRPWFCEQLL